MAITPRFADERPDKFVYLKRVTAAAGDNFSTNPAYAQVATEGIEMVSGGTLVYKNRHGTTVTVILTAGYRAIEAISIETGTTVDVICYW
jgi:hypothetical protein